MMPFLLSERAAITLSWPPLVGGLLGFCVTGVGLVTSLGLYDMRGAAYVSAATSMFDLEEYAFLTASQGTPGWHDAVQRLAMDDDLFGWLRGDYANAMNAENTVLTRATFVDDYAVTYATALARGLSLDGFVTPHELREAYTQSVIDTHSRANPAFGP